MTASRISLYFPVYLRHAVFFAAFAAAFALLYHSAIAHMVKDWSTPDGSHGPLILGVSLYLVWLKRHELRQIRPEPALLHGGLLLAAGCFMHFAGVISSTILVQMISMVPALLGAVLLFGGFSFFRILFLPVGYLVFLTGLVEQVLGGFAIYFQNFAAWFAALFFRLIGMPVFHDYTIIELPHITLEVVRACAGIGHLVALFALAVPLAHLAQKTWPRKIILVFSAFFIGLAANGFRIVLIGLYTRFFPGQGVHGPYESFQVAIIFLLGLLLLLVLSSLLDKKPGGNNPGKTGNDGHDNPGDPPADLNPSENRPARPRLYSSYVIGAIILAVTLGFVHFYTPKAVALQRPLDQFPKQIAGFVGKDIKSIHQQLRPFPADAELLRRYENNENHEAEVYIGYFRLQTRKRKVIDWRRDWMHAEATKVQVSSGDNEFVINHTRLKDKDAASDVYFWYLMNGRIVTNQYAGKLITFLSSFFTRSNNAAVIVVATTSTEKEILPLLSGLAESARNHLDPDVND
ncbi:EpsI family protein [Desulfosalsimonas propionicica]|uniref:EpsI family protein n=1 Tax=Desulfosalsimonas propionicica TaxID=332175 RepID=A0A7W0CC37_9BACT|nr:exosortase W [Desulfosalsimonas propionicica]MBA2883016.1 EpsI family protein [Desulfosalsimonas propionicica]